MSYYVWRVVQIIHWSGAIIFEIRFNFASKHYLAYHLNIIWGWADFSWVLIFVSVTLLLLSPTSLVYHFRLPNWKPEMFTLVPCYEWPLNYSFYSSHPWDYPMFICCFIPIINIWYLYAPNVICYFQYWLIDRQVYWAIAMRQNPIPQCQHHLPLAPILTPECSLPWLFFSPFFRIPTCFQWEKLVFSKLAC